MISTKQKNKAQAKKNLLCWSEHAWEDYLHWQKTNPQILQRINTLIRECQTNPFTGTGKPEPLGKDLSGYWSRRIDKVHRLVYLPEDGSLYIVKARYHY